MLRLFVDTLTTDGQDSLHNRGNLTQHIQMHLPQKKNTFSQFFCAVFKLRLNFGHFLKKMTLIGYRFPNLRTPKDVVR